MPGKALEILSAFCAWPYSAEVECIRWVPDVFSTPWGKLRIQIILHELAE